MTVSKNLAQAREEKANERLIKEANKTLHDNRNHERLRKAREASRMGGKPFPDPDNEGELLNNPSHVSEYLPATLGDLIGPTRSRKNKPTEEDTSEQRLG